MINQPTYPLPELTWLRSPPSPRPNCGNPPGERLRSRGAGAAPRPGILLFSSNDEKQARLHSISHKYVHPGSSRYVHPLSLSSITLHPNIPSMTSPHLPPIFHAELRHRMRLALLWAPASPLWAPRASLAPARAALPGRRFPGGMSLNRRMFKEIDVWWYIYINRCIPLASKPFKINRFECKHRVWASTL